MAGALGSRDGWSPGKEGWLEPWEGDRVTFALWCSPLYHLSDKKFSSETDEIWSAAFRDAGLHREKKLQGAVIPRGDAIIIYTPVRTFGAHCRYPNYYSKMLPAPQWWRGAVRAVQSCWAPRHFPPPWADPTGGTLSDFSLWCCSLSDVGEGVIRPLPLSAFTTLVSVCGGVLDPRLS